MLFPECLGLSCRCPFLAPELLTANFQEFLSEYFFFFSLNLSESFSWEYSRFLPVLLSGFIQKLIPGFPLGISSPNYVLGYRGSFLICQLECRKNRNDNAPDIVPRVSSVISTRVSTGFLKEFHIPSRDSSWSFSLDFSKKIPSGVA